MIQNDANDAVVLGAHDIENHIRHLPDAQLHFIINATRSDISPEAVEYAKREMERRNKDHEQFNSQGTKHDTGKARMDLIYPEAKLALAHVFSHGAAQYGERNCETGFAYGRISGALERHLTAWQAGQDVDPDSGLPHLWHVLWNSATLVMMTERGIGTDDRTKGAAMHMLEKPHE